MGQKVEPRLVILESPYGGDEENNTIYAKRCLRDSLDRGEAAMMSHLLYGQVLNDSVRKQRRTGIAAGLAWGKHAEATVVYMDLGISDGMLEGIDRANSEGRPIEYRKLANTNWGDKPQILVRAEKDLADAVARAAELSGRRFAVQLRGEAKAKIRACERKVKNLTAMWERGDRLPYVC
jgi:hypothetical protein